MTELLKIALELIKEIGYIPTLVIMLILTMLYVAGRLVNKKEQVLKKAYEIQANKSQIVTQQTADAIIDIKTMNAKNLSATKELVGKIDALNETIKVMLEIIMRGGGGNND